MAQRIRTILFIDDDQIIGLVSKRLLEQLEIASDVQLFHDSYLGLAALESRYQPGSPHVQQAGTDLVLLDLDMPGLGGFAILDQLLARQQEGNVSLQQAQFVIISAHIGEKEIKKAASYPILGLLDKPIRPNSCSS
ncbi:response regulator [Cesiribacter andamanensis]|uniref:Response regulator of citrate/malate metabolism n=1 Tax=Cesiribacter andamanensis AMV16 TaxID=1279009 RepID=M7NPD6_9BACT|nr:response regulator [Cesiribacter andamanensis]EMR03585.1 Response regulator of citrate/malate metabolism [Cesiribacter andamanensis AMV16]